MSFEDHVSEALRAIAPRQRDDVCMLGVWVTARGSAIVGWNTASRLSANGTAWEWHQWRFECPSALVIDPAPSRERIEVLMRELHRTGRIAAILGHAVGFIVDGELAPCST
jgi:hypothetical protein